MDYAYYVLFALIACLCAILEFTKIGTSSKRTGATAAFQRFRNNYLLVYCLMFAGDWLQGPYVYALYQHYGYSVGDIGRLFIAGFASSIAFGTFMGPLADRCGRKLGGLLYVAIYIGSCITKHFNNFWLLLLGRVFGGTATSLLFSTFESWLVAEHSRRNYSEELLGNTFSLAVLLGQGLTAILSGLLANFLVEGLRLGPVAPFDAAATLLLAGGLLISRSWSENTGDASAAGTILDQLGRAARAIRSDKQIALLGAIQSLFEGSMYTFVFLWTPALSLNGVSIPHGLIFALFMVSCMTGSAAAGHAVAANMRTERYLKAVFAVSASCMAVPMLYHGSVQPPQQQPSRLQGQGLQLEGWVQLLAFCVFEATVGVFWPSMMKLRARYVPEEMRATIINCFRIPLNLFVCIVLFNVSQYPLSVMFGMCVIFLSTGMVCLHLLDHASASIQDSPDNKASTLLP